MSLYSCQFTCGNQTTVDTGTGRSVYKLKRAEFEFLTFFRMDEDDTEGRAKSPSIVSASGMRRKPNPVDIYAKTPLDIYATNPS